MKQITDDKHLLFKVENSLQQFLFQVKIFAKKPGML